MEKNKDAMERIQSAFRKIQTDLYEVADSPMGIVIGLKFLLAQRGLCSSLMALPVYALLSDEQKLKLNTLDKEILLLGKKSSTSAFLELYLLVPCPNRQALYFLIQPVRANRDM